MAAEIKEDKTHEPIRIPDYVKFMDEKVGQWISESKSRIKIGSRPLYVEYSEWLTKQGKAGITHSGFILYLTDNFKLSYSDASIKFGAWFKIDINKLKSTIDVIKTNAERRCIDPRIIELFTGVTPSESLISIIKEMLDK